MADARAREGRSDAEASGERVEMAAAVEVDVLARVDEIEAGDPDGEREPEHEHGRLEGAAHGDPAARCGDAIGEAQYPVRGPGEALRVRIADQEEGGQGRQL